MCNCRCRYSPDQMAAVLTRDADNGDRAGLAMR
jgi:hypothetical protein